MASKRVMGSASQPPKAAGSDSRNRPACFTLAARSAGMVRLASPSAARARNSGARAAARARISPRVVVMGSPPSFPVLLALAGLAADGPRRGSNCQGEFSAGRPERGGDGDADLGGAADGGSYARLAPGSWWLVEV